ncbi:MAG TPA: class I SAM-dependent methyltransferase [bacterium]|nr:class I SAM-dependent methyltransferase [bacterium]
MSGRRVAKMIGLALHQAERAAAFADRSFRRALLLARSRTNEERESAHWSRPGKNKVLTWQDHPVIRQNINRRVSGDPSVNWLEFFAREFGGHDLTRALNLGCGRGDLEAHAFSLGLVKSFHSLDLSEGAVAAARERLRGLPVEFERMDLNRLRLEAGAYDVVFAASSLHHLLDLEHVLDEARRGLRDGGLLVFNEYVGPSRFQWTDEQLRIVNELLRGLAPRYRKNLWRGWGLKRRAYRAALDERNRDSPFEAARSEEILPLTAARYEIVMKRDYGGAVLHPLLDGIAGNFCAERALDVELLRRLAELEEELERAGTIASDFTVVVARKRRGHG